MTLPVRGVLRRVVQLQIVLLLLLVLFATGAVLTYRSAEASARETGDTLVHLATLRADVLSAETGLRGYLLVNESPFLQPYRDAFPAIAVDLAGVRGHLAAADEQRLAAIVATVEDWRSNFAEVVLADVAKGDRASALALTASGVGKARIDRVRAFVEQIAASTTRRLDNRRNDASRRGAAGLLASGLVVVGFAATAVGGRRRLQRAVADPLEALAATADRLGGGDLTARAETTGVTEIERLATAFNTMAVRTETTVSGLRTVDRLKSEFVSVVSHELRTPLTSIRGSLGLLDSGAMGEIPSDAADMLRIAVSNTDRLIRLINDILDLERIESGVETLHVAPVSVDALTSDARQAVEGLADDAGVHIEITPTTAMVEVDADRIVQALTNLLGNSIKFSQRGGVVRLDTQERGQEVVLRVADEGRGIPADRLDAIFERFQQIDASDAREKGGTGLGLAIVRSIVHRHGGRIDVTSQVGRGSAFTIVLPRAATTSVRAPTSPSRAASVVMLVEDDTDLRDVLAAMLARHGITVATAATSQDAIDRCRQEPPDLLVLDVQLAEGSGYEVVRALRQDDRLRNVPTVIYTVADLADPQRDALRLGETVFVAKGQRADEQLELIVVDLLGGSTRSP